jgi:predicted ribosome quality control (RQC) complex YloA/Tae2 family protein
VEGLLIADELQRLQPLLPSRRLGWRFPDSQTFVLPLSHDGLPGVGLWFFNRPPNPRLELRQEVPAPGRTHSGFQDLLAARASGDLVSAEQPKLDRVLSLGFAAGAGFVETSPVRLVAELTGRNCNLILLDRAGLVLGAAREVRSDVNRFRQVVKGRPYAPPPPYEKLDPRSAGREELRQALRGESLRSLRARVDGFGPLLARAVARTAGLPEDRRLEGHELEGALDALQRIAREPSAVVRETLKLPDLAELRASERRQAVTARLEQELKREARLLEKRLEDLERARSAAEETDELRRSGDLLLAFANRVPAGADFVTLPDFSGRPLRLSLDASKDAPANAQAYYERARKREGRARQADQREPELRARLRELDELLSSLEGMEVGQLESLAQSLLPDQRAERRSGPGARYQGPHGFSILVGRNARENDEITFKVARSRDMWLHVQGYHGAHVLIRAENREVPFDTLLFAARLAAGYSKAADSDNVPVDYTLRKNVWKVKGQSAGAVNFTRHKTVYVTPSRRPDDQA